MTSAVQVQPCESVLDVLKICNKLRKDGHTILSIVYGPFEKSIFGAFALTRPPNGYYVFYITKS